MVLFKKISLTVLFCTILQRIFSYFLQLETMRMEDLLPNNEDGFYLFLICHGEGLFRFHFRFFNPFVTDCSIFEHLFVLGYFTLKECSIIEHSFVFYVL